MSPRFRRVSSTWVNARGSRCWSVRGGLPPGSARRAPAPTGWAHADPLSHQPVRVKPPGRKVKRRNRTPIEVRPALRQDVAAASTVMARAFLDDPPFSWVLPAAETRERRLGRFLSVAMKADAFGRRPPADVEVATRPGRRVGAAIGHPPGTWPPTLRHQLATLPGNIWALGRRLGAASALARALGSARPRRPHWYRAYTGVEPALRGHGVASALLRHRLAPCDGGPRRRLSRVEQAQQRGPVRALWLRADRRRPRPRRRADHHPNVPRRTILPAVTPPSPADCSSTCSPPRNARRSSGLKSITFDCSKEASAGAPLVQSDHNIRWCRIGSGRGDTRGRLLLSRAGLSAANSGGPTLAPG